MSSSTKASISSGVGGSPIRSKKTRRISVALSAGGAGVSPFSSSLARMNRSIGERGHARSLTGGGAGLETGWNDQNDLSWADVHAGPCVAPVRGRGERLGTARAPTPGRASGQNAPRLTHSVRAAISSSLSFFLGGMLHFPLVANRLDQRAFLGFARHDGRPGLTPLEHRGTDIEPQPSLVLFGPVALQAVVSEHRANLRLEEIFLSRLELALGRLRVDRRARTTGEFANTASTNHGKICSRENRVRAITRHVMLRAAEV